MANKRRRELAAAATESLKFVPGPETLDTPNHGSPAEYAQYREQRIKENFERMQKLGIVDLFLKLKIAVATKRAHRSFSSEHKTPIRALATEPGRRSSRLQNVTPVRYVENMKLPKKERKISIFLEEVVKPE